MAIRSSCLTGKPALPDGRWAASYVAATSLRVMCLGCSDLTKRLSMGSHLEGNLYLWSLSVTIEPQVSCPAACLCRWPAQIWRFLSCAWGRQNKSIKRQICLDNCRARALAMAYSLCSNFIASRTHTYTHTHTQAHLPLSLAQPQT